MCLAFGFMLQSGMFYRLQLKPRSYGRYHFIKGDVSEFSLLIWAVLILLPAIWVWRKAFGRLISFLNHVASDDHLTSTGSEIRDADSRFIDSDPFVGDRPMELSARGSKKKSVESGERHESPAVAARSTSIGPRLGRVAYAVAVLAVILVTNVLFRSQFSLHSRMTDLQLFVTVVANPTAVWQPLSAGILGYSILLSIVLSTLGFLRSKDAGGRGKIVAFLMLGYFIVPPVWLLSIYLMVIKRRAVKDDA